MGPSGPLKPFAPEPFDELQIIDRTIERWTPYAGTYGMGGPGFLGFQFGSNWLIIAIWGASDWLRLEGRLVTDFFWEMNERPSPWVVDETVDFQDLFVGRSFTSLMVCRDSIDATLDDGRVLRLSPDPNDRPAHEGDGEPRIVGEDDDLRTVVFLAPTAEIWI